MVSCILLAAGSSTRFGSPKPLARIGGQPLIEFTLRKLLKTKLSEIIVVLGAEAKKIKACVLKEPQIKSVINNNYQLGQTSSFKAGLTALSPQTQGIMLLPIDMPCVSLETIDLLIDNFLKDPDTILIPVYQARNGHPTLFPVKLLKDFKDLKNEEPLSSIQHKHASATLRFPVYDEGVIKSFNTPDEFEQILEYLDIVHQ
jgi:molybdenum cofactor cytidylyltransferase